jgi:uncharacterized membrane protein YkvA (DUF1232 family)
MSNVNERCLESFPAWLRTLGTDAEKLLELLAAPKLSENARRIAAGGINYLFKSLDLVPDGIDDIGYLDDAFVMRVTADLMTHEDTSGLSTEQLRDLGKLANDCELIRAYLGDDYGRLEAYVTNLKRGSARGRTVDDIVTDREVQNDFSQDVRSFSKGYQSPGFAREEKNLIKLKAFFDAKLPR